TDSRAQNFKRAESVLTSLTIAKAAAAPPTRIDVFGASGSSNETASASSSRNALRCVAVNACPGTLDAGFTRTSLEVCNPGIRSRETGSELVGHAADVACAQGQHEIAR